MSQPGMGLGVEAMMLRQGGERWSDLDQLMGETSKSLGKAPVSGLAPDCQGAASSFLAAWSGYASESAAIARGFAKALEATDTDMTGTDGATSSDFSRLDGRLGPAL